VSVDTSSISTHSTPFAVLSETSDTVSSCSSLDGTSRTFSSSSDGMDDSIKIDMDMDIDAFGNVITESGPSVLPVSSPSPPADPYHDVRERIEALSLADRMRFAYHSLDNDDLGNEGENTHEYDSSSHLPTIPFFVALTTYLGYAVLIAAGHTQDFLCRLTRTGPHKNQHDSRKNKDGSFVCPSYDVETHATLLKSWENFYREWLYNRCQDAFNRPLASRPASNVKVLERVSSDGNRTMTVLGPLQNLHAHSQQLDGNSRDMLEYHYTRGKHFDTVEDGRVVRRCLNLGSYNYLGFADDWDVTCSSGVLSSLQDLPVSVSSSRLELGTTKLHKEVEHIVASFLGKDDAMALNMGFNTNATVIPALVGRGDLIISDEINHTSIVNGARTSGAAIRCFRHNDCAHLRRILKQAIVMGRPRTRRPFGKIVVIVEGIYSMEGEYCDLRGVAAACKEYGAYLYLDEAHSIGAMGSTGRGCCEYTGVDPGDVDVLMGTFTKSFGGMGGYVAGDADLITSLRVSCAGSTYHNSLSPVVCQQIISSFKVIMGQDGTNIGKQKIAALRDNANYTRMRLTDMGLHVLGHYDSPIIPVMLYNPTKIPAFSRECFKRGLAVVVVGFPAVPILMSRARFCISAGHTREDLDLALGKIDEIADILKLRYGKSSFG